MILWVLAAIILIILFVFRFELFISIFFGGLLLWFIAKVLQIFSDPGRPAPSGKIMIIKDHEIRRE